MIYLNQATFEQLIQAVAEHELRKAQAEDASSVSKIRANATENFQVNTAPAIADAIKTGQIK